MTFGTWKKVLGSPEIQRSSHVLNVVNGQIYLFGGEIQPRQPVLAEVYVVDAKKG